MKTTARHYQKKSGDNLSLPARLIALCAMALTPLGTGAPDLARVDPS
jgi:hypothetical protein